MVDSTYLTAAVQNIWNAWNIRGFMILSLSMQLILSMAAPCRKKTRNGFTIFVVWSTYFLADWVAVFAIGLISNARCKNSNSEVEVAQDVMALWAAFLLIHLGGPDTITAFSLEDNALWLRHLVGLIAQLFAFLYIFVKTLPDNKLLVPTILIFVSGMIKYGERTRALYLASLENLKKSIKNTPDRDGLTLLEVTRSSFYFYNIFKGLIVDIMPDLAEWNESREFISKQNADEVFSLIAMELNFLYEFLYTKIMAAKSGWGALIRSFAYFCALASLIMFCLAEKDELLVVDVSITYALLGGVFLLDLASLMMISRSEWTAARNFYLCLQVIGQGFFPFYFGLALVWYLVQGTAFADFINRRWSGNICSFNLLSLCFRQSRWRKYRKPGFIWDKLAEMRHTTKVFFWSDLWSLIFEDVKNKAENAVNQEIMRQVYEARGDCAIQESGCLELLPYVNGLLYDNTIVVWHVATEMCYNLEKDDVGSNEMKRYSKMLSEYMMYLLVKQPKLMSAVAGIGHIRYEHTCFEAKLLGRKFGAPTMREFCALILEEHANITEPDVEAKHYALSVLSDACGLVRLLRENNDRWEIMFKVWMEMLAYAAGHCKADSHARLLSQGGEFITFVWMLSAHCGVVAYFPVK